MRELDESIIDPSEEAVTDDPFFASLSASFSDSELISRNEILKTLELMFARMDAVDAACEGGFPIYSRGDEDKWKISSGGSWVGGFWAGQWWLRAKVTRSTSDRLKALEICRRLSDKTGVDSVNRSMIFWYGAALGNLWFGEAEMQRSAKESLAALVASYNSDMACFPVGTAMGGGEDGAQRISIDSFAPLIQLLTSDCQQHSKSEQADQIARCHADTLIANCQNGSGAYYSGAVYEQSDCQPIAAQLIGKPGNWSRGQAWAMLGLSRAAAIWGGTYRDAALAACDYWMCSRTDSIPLNRLDRAAGLLDPSASVIASLAMLSMAEVCSIDNNCAESLRRSAYRQIGQVIRSEFFTCHVNNADEAPFGIFWGGCYRTKPGEDEMVESPWGSFFLMAASAILVGMIEPNSV